LAPLARWRWKLMAQHFRISYFNILINEKTKESLEKLVNQVVFFFISGFSPAGVIIRLRGQIGFLLCCF
jgi:hypothetical protein